MIPSAAYELLASDTTLNGLGITPSRIKELQSTDTRPYDSGYFLILNWEEVDFRPYLGRGERTLTVWVHHPWDRDRNYKNLDKILNRIDAIFAAVEHEIGSDGVRVSGIRKTGISGNLVDDGWKTIARNSVYGVLYDTEAA